MRSLLALAVLLAGCGAELERSQRALTSVQNDELRLELDYDGARLTTIRHIRNERIFDRLDVEYRDDKISTILWFNREEDELPSSSTTYTYDGDRLLAMSARLMNSGSINFVDWGYDLTYVYEGDRLVSRRSESPGREDMLCNVELTYGEDGALRSVDGALGGDVSCDRRLELTSVSGRLERIDRVDEREVGYSFVYDSEDRLVEVITDEDRYQLSYRHGLIARIESGELVTTFEYAEHEVEGAVIPPFGLPFDVDDFFDLAGRGYPSIEPLTNIADLTWVRGITIN